MSKKTLHQSRQANEGITYELLGKHLGINGERKSNEVARRKYGENHAKLATLLDLAVINRMNRTFLISQSVIGEASRVLSIEEKKHLMLRLLFRIPIIQNCLQKSFKEKFFLDNELKCLSKATQKRRKPNVEALFELIEKNAPEGTSLAKAVKNIIR